MIFKAPILFTVILTNGKTEMDISKYTHEKTGSTALFDYWSISIEPKFKRLRYGFELKSETDTLIYAERGFFSSIPNDDVGNFSVFHLFMQMMYSKHHLGLKTPFGIRFSLSDSLMAIVR